MGLVEETSQSKKFAVFIQKYHGYLTAVCFIVGSIWFAILADHNHNAGTYFSENALLPGLVDGKFNMDHEVQFYLENLQEEIERYQGDMPTAWLRSQFTQLGLEAYLHNFTLHYPFGSGVTIEGYNVYAILRAPRTASTEALVLCAPFRSALSVYPTTAPGIALMLALAKFFKQHTYWAKDIVFLISEHEHLGTKAWLEAYHSSGTFDGVLDAGLLIHRSGAIQAAINIEIHSKQTSWVDLKIEGLTGQLPNLDLFNLAVRLCYRENVPVTFKNRPNYYNPQTPEGWLHNLATMMAMVRSQATGIPTGNHAIFLQYNIEALTLEGHTSNKRGSNLISMGRVLEGIFRSLNNLLESFHQSFFFYLLPSTDRYVSIGLYMPPFGFILAAIAIMTLKLRIESQNPDSFTLKTGDTSVDNSPSDDGENFKLISVIPYVVFSHAIGVALFLSPVPLDYIGQKATLNTQDAIFYGILVIVALALLLLPNFIHRFIPRRQILSWKVLKYVTLLEIGLLLGTVSLANFSLAILVSFFSVPVVLNISPSSSRCCRWIKGIFLFLISPLGLAFLAVVYDTYKVHPEMRFDRVLQHAVLASKRALLYSITDSYIYNNWMFRVACIFHFPTWLQLWCTLHMPLTNIKTKTS